MNIKKRNRLIEENMDLVKKLAGLFWQCETDREELEAEGNLALVVAADNWDGKRPFGRYASVCVYNKMREFISRDTLIPISWKRLKDGESTPQVDALKNND